jgi:hypothetical protein
MMIRYIDAAANRRMADNSRANDMICYSFRATLGAIAALAVKRLGAAYFPGLGFCI